MDAPLPFNNKEAEECAGWLEMMAGAKPDVEWLKDAILTAEKARRIAASLRWMATERTATESSTGLIVAGKSKLPVKAVDLVGALTEVASESMNAQQRREFESGTLFAYWQSRTDNMGISWTREKATRAQKFIRMFGFETCLWSVDGVMGHPDFNHGDGSTHHSFTTIFNHKDTERVEKLAEYARKRNKNKQHRMIARLVEQGYKP